MLPTHVAHTNSHVVEFEKGASPATVNINLWYTCDSNSIVKFSFVYKHLFSLSLFTTDYIICQYFPMVILFLDCYNYINFSWTYYSKMSINFVISINNLTIIRNDYKVFVNILVLGIMTTLYWFSRRMIDELIFMEILWCTLISEPFEVVSDYKTHRILKCS